MGQSLISVHDATKYLVCTLLDLVTVPEPTYRFVGGNFSWKMIFFALEKIQGVKWTVTYKSVDEAKSNQLRAITSGDLDAELEASHQVIQGTGRTLLPKPYDNNKFPEECPQGLEETLRAMFESKERFPFLGF